MIPPRESALRRLPIWLKIGIPLTIVLLGLIVLAAIQVLQEKIPAYGQVPAVQERFAQQIAVRSCERHPANLGPGEAPSRRGFSGHPARQ